MFCPECEAEYRPGFTECSDCQVPLVAERRVREQIPDNRLPDDHPKSVWTGDSMDQCVRYCRELRAADIPYQVVQGVDQFGKSLTRMFNIGVAEQDFEDAKALIKKDEAFSDEDAAVELPAEDGDAPDDEIGYADSSDWYPEDATIEVWSDKSESQSDLVALSLSGLGINTRKETDADGTHRLFVLPDRERRALEIVREIREGQPPA